VRQRLFSPCLPNATRWRDGKATPLVDSVTTALAHTCMQTCGSAAIAARTRPIISRPRINARRRHRVASAFEVCGYRETRNTINSTPDYYGGRAFPIAAAEAWNGLLTSSVTSAPSLETFRRSLKIELFSNSFSHVQ